jgi:hypothetical protein
MLLSYWCLMGSGKGLEGVWCRREVIDIDHVSFLFFFFFFFSLLFFFSSLLGASSLVGSGFFSGTVHDSDVHILSSGSTFWHIPQAWAPSFLSILVLLRAWKLPFLQCFSFGIQDRVSSQMEMSETGSHGLVGYTGWCIWIIPLYRVDALDVWLCTSLAVGVGVSLVMSFVAFHFQVRLGTAADGFCTF